MNVLKFARLNIPVIIGRIQEEVAAIEKKNWQPHFNRSHYEGQWNVLSLPFPGGEQNALADAMNNEDFTDTALMKQCPSVQYLINQFDCKKSAVRLLNLHSGAIIKEHTDKELCFEKGEARLHFPIFTNDEVEFFL